MFTELVSTTAPEVNVKYVVIFEDASGRLALIAFKSDTLNCTSISSPVGCESTPFADNRTEYEAVAAFWSVKSFSKKELSRTGLLKTKAKVPVFILRLYDINTGGIESRITLLAARAVDGATARFELVSLKAPDKNCKYVFVVFDAISVRFFNVLSDAIDSVIPTTVGMFVLLATSAFVRGTEADGLLAAF